MYALNSPSREIAWNRHHLGLQSSCRTTVPKPNDNRASDHRWISNTWHQTHQDYCIISSVCVRGCAYLAHIRNTQAQKVESSKTNMCLNASLPASCRAAAVKATTCKFSTSWLSGSRIDFAGMGLGILTLVLRLLFWKIFDMNFSIQALGLIL